MILSNVRIVLPHEVIDGSIYFENGVITKIEKGISNDNSAIDCHHQILMPGYIDIHVHGSLGVDFMEANSKDIKNIAKAFYSEGITSFLVTTLTSDYNSLKKVCETVKEAIKDTPSCIGIHLEGPYISYKYKGAQNPDYIRNPNINEFDDLQTISGNNIRCITLAPEKENSLKFIQHVTSNKVTVSVGHSDASFVDVKKAIDCGLTNTTHTHNAMSGHHHRNPGIVTAAFYFDNLYTEFICDFIHVCKETIKTSYKIIGSDRFVLITDALKIKHCQLDKFELFGLPCYKKDGAAYLESGPLAGSILTMEQAVKNMKQLCNLSLSDLSKISSRNAAKSLHMTNIGEIKIGNNADFVLLDDNLNVLKTYKLGVLVYER